MSETDDRKQKERYTDCLEATDCDLRKRAGRNDPERSVMSRQDICDNCGDGETKQSPAQNLRRAMRTPAEIVRELRKETGLSQAKFGEKYGIPANTIKSWEYGPSAPPEYLLRALSVVVRADLEGGAV